MASRTGREGYPIKNGWREESGQLVTDREGASIQGDFKVPSKATVEFALSWKVKPDFVFALGIDPTEMRTVKRAFRFEAWGGDLVIQRELDNEADLAVVQEIAPGPGRTHLQAYIDQQAGQILVCSTSGKRLANLKVGGVNEKAFPGLYLANLRGDLRLEWLRIGQWTGELPREVQLDQSRIHRVDGTLVYGQIVRFDASSRDFVVRSSAGEVRIAESTISSVFLSAAGDDRPRQIRVVYDDGTRLSGTLEKVENSSLVMSVPGVHQPVRLPTAGLRSVIVTRRNNDRPPARSDVTGRLEAEGLRLAGRLVDGAATPDASCLVWEPLQSDTAAPMKPGVSGRIIYRDRPPAATSRRPPRLIEPRMAVVRGVQNRDGPAVVAGAAGRFLKALDEPAAVADPPAIEPRSLYLRDGDTIPSTITGIDENGVWFKTSLSKSTFVPHQKVKAVELAADAALDSAVSAEVVRLTEAKRERLLTLPRMQQTDPPTHLIRSRNGDYLRGRVTKMDSRTLEVEIRLDRKRIPRDRIAQIIWLQPDELDATKPPASLAQGNHSVRVQALRNDGIRLTFQAERFEGFETYRARATFSAPARLALPRSISS